MKRKILVDSSYLFARVFKNDSCHKRAIVTHKELAKDPSSYEFIVGMNVYSEILTLISQRIGKSKALEYLNLLNEEYELINPDEDTYIKADTYFRKAKSKNISYSDCISFAIMDQENIELVLGFDDHFKQMGYKRVGIDT